MGKYRKRRRRTKAKTKTSRTVLQHLLAAARPDAASYIVRMSRASFAALPGLPAAHLPVSVSQCFVSSKKLCASSRS
ncbi:hypothetical protein Q1695_015231 [Nippostrongylus brasiliensis]|nr:hypothetical protein Q1695_015231 [Nippostrongylus brasiliensis]